MTTVDTAHLRALAEAATPGPWHASADEVFTDDADQVADVGASCLAFAADAAHIAANSPAAVIAMCAEIDRLRADVEHLRGVEDAAMEAVFALQSERDAAVARAEGAEHFIAFQGYRRCSVAACNCGSWHGGHAGDRLGEIRDALEDGGIEINGITLLDAIQSLVARAEEAEAQVGLERATEKGLDR